MLIEHVDLLGGTRERRLDDLLRLVRLRAVKGGLTVTDRQFLRDETERLGLTREDVDALMSPFAPLPEPPPEFEENDEGLSTEEVQEIRAALDALGRRDLYHVLDLQHDAPAAEIGLRLHERRRGNTAPEAAAHWAAAIELAQVHLGAKEARTRYNRSLASETANRFVALSQRVLTGQPKLDQDTHKALLSEAAAAGLRPERAEACIRQACRAEGVLVEAPRDLDAATEERRRWLRCRACGGLTEFGWAHAHPSAQCRHCIGRLQWDCPVCNETSWVDEPRCRCGFLLENLEPLVRHFEAAQRAFRQHQNAAALAHLRAVQAYAPTHAGARKGLEKLQARVVELRKLRAAFDQERAAGRLVAARALLDRWERLVAPNDARWRSSLEDVAGKLADAERLTSRGHQMAESDATEARALYRRALVIAADLPAAVDGLRRCPPDGPTELHAEVRHARVALRWTPPAPDGLGPLAFRVLRKRNEAPSHTADGVVVAETDRAEWEDASVVAGDLFGYAVCAVRNGSASLYGVSSGPFLVTDEVRGVRLETRPGKIELSWTAPAAAASVRVVRKVGGPVENPRDGVSIESTLDAAVDSELVDGHAVHYAIYAVYRMPDGRPQLSSPIHVSAIAGAPPEPVDDLRLEAELDGRLWLHWTPMKHAHVNILRSEYPLAWLRGERRRPGEVESLEGTWLEPIAPGEAAEPLEDGPALSYYTPFSVASGIAVVGRAATWARLPDPRGLRVAWEPGETERALLRWNWGEAPPGAKVLVVARAGRFASGPDDTEALRIVVDPETYWRDGGAFIALSGSNSVPWHIAVHTCLDEQGERWCSPGIEASARAVLPVRNGAVTLYYKVEPPRMGNTWQIHVQTEPAGCEVGPLVLVARSRVLPLSERDGTVLARYAGAFDGSRLALKPTSRLAGRKLRLFPDSSSAPPPGALSIALCVERT